MLPPAPASCCPHHSLLSLQEPGFAEVLPNLTAQEMDWLVQGELTMALERAGGPGLRISGHIAARQSCDGEAGWGLAPRAHTTKRHRQVAGVGMGGIVWAGRMNGCRTSRPPPISPLCSPAKRPLRGRCPDPSSDGCSRLSQPYTTRKWLPDLPGKSQGLQEVGGQQAGVGLWPSWFRPQAFSATSLCPPQPCPPGTSGRYRQ